MQLLKITIIYSHDPADLLDVHWAFVGLLDFALCVSRLPYRTSGLAWTRSLLDNVKNARAQVEILNVYWPKQITGPNPMSRSPQNGEGLQSYNAKTTNTVKRYRIRAQNTIYQNPSTKNITPQRPLTLTWLKIPAIKITLLN